MLFLRRDSSISVTLRSGEDVKYCLTITSTRSRQVKTICSSSIDDLLSTAHALKNVDIYVHTLPKPQVETVSVRLRK